MPVVLLPGHPEYHSSRKFRIVPIEIVIKCGNDAYERTVHVRRPDSSGTGPVHPATTHRKAVEEDTVSTA